MVQLLAGIIDDANESWWVARSAVCLQYLAGLGLNRYEGGAIYREIETYRKFPEGLLARSSDSEEARAKLLGFAGGDAH